MTVSKLNLPPPDMLKIPPHSIEAEQCVLGSILITGGKAYRNIEDLVTPECFYSRAHQIIFKSLAKMSEDNAAIDIITLEVELKEQGELEECGGFKYLGELANNTPSAANVRSYAETIKQRYLLRQLLDTAYDLEGACYVTNGKTAEQITADIEERLSLVSEKFETGEHDYSCQSAQAELLDYLEARNKKKGIQGISTGFADIDRQTDGLIPGMVVIAARPGMGKTTLGLNMLRTEALNGGNPYFFSIEMPRLQVMMKLQSDDANVEFNKIKNARLSDDEWGRVSDSMARFDKSNLYVNDYAIQTPTSMRIALRSYQKKVGKPTLIMVDYLQLMRVPGKDRFEEISEASRSLTAISKEFNCPVIAISQLSRKLEDRRDKRPMLSDLRESGQIEQDATIVMFIYRDDYYTDKSPAQGVAEIIIPKNRLGETGSKNLTFMGQYSRFADFARPEGYVDTSSVDNDEGPDV